MKKTSYIKEEKELHLLKKYGIGECILSPVDLSRKSLLPMDKVISLGKRARELGISPVLEWDILMEEKRFQAKKKILQSLDLELFDAVRVADPGALEFLLQKAHAPIHWVVEHGNHNLEGLLKWRDYIGTRLERLVLSHEIPYMKLVEYEKKLNCPLEILLLGRILIFYSPRPLLEGFFPEEQGQIKALASSEESSHRNFQVEENTHGSFMYHLRDFCLIQEQEKLENLSSFWGRIEGVTLSRGTFEKGLKLLSLFNKELWEDFKAEYPRKLTKGFFLVNKTDIIFPKLKNHRLLRTDDSYVGEVVDVLKGKYLIIAQKSSRNFLKKGEEFLYMTPEGKDLYLKLDKLMDLEGEEIEKIEFNQYIMTAYKKGITPKTIVRLK